MSRRRAKQQISFPKNVHCVTSKGREYFYYQVGRGTESQGTRISLPRDPHSPEFWQAIRTAQGGDFGVVPETVAGVADEYISYLKTAVATGSLVTGTFKQYEHSMGVAKAAWGALSIKGLRPVHVQAIMDGMAHKPGAANNFLSSMRAFSKWARVRDHIEYSLTEGVDPYAKDEGHKPWTEEQITVALEKLTGVIRQGVLLYYCTGMRGSDAVRLGWADIEDGGFAMKTQKKKRDVWCPILPELAEEMKDWERRPGPFLLQEDGRAKGGRFSRKLFSKHFAEQRDNIPQLAGLTLHGLRATAVIRLRRAGLTTGQIGDIVGMSLATIERYCRFADRKISGKAALATFEEHEKNKIVKPSKTAKLN